MKSSASVPEIAIIGWSGFIGTALCRRLRDIGKSFVIVGRCKPSDSAVPHFRLGMSERGTIWPSALREVKIVYYLGWSTKPASANRDPFGDFKANVQAVVEFLEEYKREDYRFRIVFFSSGGAVYGDKGDICVNERELCLPLNAYGVGKLTAEHYLSLYHHLYGLDYVILRPSNAYGEGQNAFADQGAVAVFLGRILRGIPIEIWGDGGNVRDYIYISDVVDAAIAAGRYQCPNGGVRLFNVGSGCAVSLHELVDVISCVVGQPVDVIFKEERRVDVRAIRLDSKLAMEHLAWQASVGLEEGIKRTWYWMQRSSA